MTETGPSDLLEAFLHHLAHERRLSANTLSNYRRDLTRVREVIGFEPKVDLDDLIRSVIHYFER